MLTCQKSLFSIPDQVTYLNCAYMGPLLKSVEKAGVAGLTKKSTPYKISADDFFEPVEEMRALYAQLIEVDEPDRISVIPAASYGISTVINNLPLKHKGNIIMMEHQFPSHVYAWREWAKEHHIEIRIIKPDVDLFANTYSINDRILEQVDNQTIAVAIGHIHWADGRLFDLSSIRVKTHSHNALLIIDGTQSVGALPFSVKEFEPDALIVAAYKWLLGPYSFGLAYFGERFDGGRPIEENWINRKDSHVFQKLVNYQDEYKPLAHRYNVGELSNFIAVPMMIESLKQINQWGVQNIQDYTRNILNPVIDEFQSIGCKIESADQRSNHLFGIHLPDSIDVDRLKNNFKEAQVFISFRGDFIRVSPHLYNTTEDLRKLITIIDKTMNS